MIDLGKTTDVHRLYAAIDHSRKALLPFRNQRVDMLREFVGSHYGDKGQGASHEVLVNLLNFTADVYTHGLAANNPRIRVTSQFTELMPFAYNWQQSLNNMIKEMRFRNTMQQIILDAFFVGGIAKVFQASWQPVQLEDDTWADPGRPYIGRISFDNFGLDMAATDIRCCRFMYDEYRVSWKSVQDDPDFDKSVVKNMSPTSKWDRDSEYAEGISQGSLVDDDEYEPMTDLMDVWLPELEKVGIFAKHTPSKPLKLVEAGPEGGPYHFLSFADVPDNIMPTAPAQNLMGLHKLYNGLLRKQGQQAKRQKTNTIFRANAVDDAQRLRNANDGDIVFVNDPDAVKVVTQGGVDPTNTAFGMNVMDLFDRQAGNLSAMAGLGPQADTVGQEQLIHQAVSRKEAKMQQRVHNFTSDLIRSLGQLMWVDGMLNVPSSVEVASGSGVRVDTSWTPEMREGDFLQYNFEIEPHSMDYESPAAKLQKLERAADRLIQMFPIIQAAGGTIDVQQIQRDMAEMQGTPELRNWITFATPPTIEQPGPTGGAPPVRPSTTTRNYVRSNVSTGGTPQNRSAQMQQAWMGMGKGQGGGQGMPQAMSGVS